MHCGWWTNESVRAHCVRMFCFCPQVSQASWWLVWRTGRLQTYKQVHQPDQGLQWAHQGRHLVSSGAGGQPVFFLSVVHLPVHYYLRHYYILWVTRNFATNEMLVVPPSLLVGFFAADDNMFKCRWLGLFCLSCALWPSKVQQNVLIVESWRYNL